MNVSARWPIRRRIRIGGYPRCILGGRDLLEVDLSLAGAGHSAMAISTDERFLGWDGHCKGRAEGQEDEGRSNPHLYHIRRSLKK